MSEEPNQTTEPTPAPAEPATPSPKLLFVLLGVWAVWIAALLVLNATT